MKKLFTILLFLLPSIAYFQAAPDLYKVSDDVIKIKEISFDGLFKKSGWVYYFDLKNGNLIKRKNYYKGDIRSNKVYCYEKDTITIIETDLYSQYESIVKNIYSKKKPTNTL